ncbi:hypothetical protein [Devosia nitrariae]|uniref:Uncharacterized protein n=1 Tax=Devosia nitrariae TaxID=2071872 RepID=A0ABQ5W0H4_9HYPH|nr:hypothetical protein [Devosia nitrariae]GLQ53392.1 hypothetical protein GCM10010862_06500 [Devosia nitrariae]
MHRLFILISTFASWLAERDRPVDVIETMSPRERADLPVHHPAADHGAAC